MGHYNTVKKGDPFRPSATLENEVRRFFNGGAPLSGGKSKTGGSNNIRISAHNSTTQEIGAYTPVAIFHNDEQDYFYIEPTTTDTGLWGIATGNIAPNSSGTVVVSGIVNAMIAPGSGDFAVPYNGVLKRSSSGNARVLYGGDGEDKPGMILLGGTSGSGYAGPFAIHVTPLTQTSADIHITGGECIVNGTYCPVHSFSESVTFDNENDDSTTETYVLFVVPPTEDDPLYCRVSIHNAKDIVDTEDRTKTPWIIIGQVVAGTAEQWVYGTPFIPWFASCSTCTEDYNE